MRIIAGFAVIVAFSLCYMEWGGSNHSFVAQAEYNLLFKQDNLLTTLLHPVILSGLTGQLLILCHAFSLTNRKWVLLTATIMLSVVPALILLSGLLSLNIKMIASVIPFVCCSVINYQITFKKQPLRN